MPFLTKEKTNWKYILIVVILAAIVGGRVLFYLGYFEKEIISLTKYPEIKKPEKSKVEEVANWKTYRDEEYSFEFEYPQDWGDIIPVRVGAEDFSFYVSNKKIRTALYRIKSKNLFFIEQGKPRKYEWGGEMFEKILKVIFPNKEIKELYRFEPVGIFEREDFWDKVIREKFVQIKFSPDEKYIAFMVPGWDFNTPVLMNIYTGTNILSISECYGVYDEFWKETFQHPCEIWYSDTFNSVYWSPQGKVLAIIGKILPFGSGELGGVGGLFVSDYNNPEKLNPVICISDIFKDLKWPATECGVLKYYHTSETREIVAEISRIRFINDEKLLIAVTVKGKTTKYEYYPETKELIEKE
jgi:hypothetical protein